MLGCLCNLFWKGGSVTSKNLPAPYLWSLIHSRQLFPSQTGGVPVQTGCCLWGRQRNPWQSLGFLPPAIPPGGSGPVLGGGSSEDQEVKPSQSAAGGDTAPAASRDFWWESGASRQMHTQRLCRNQKVTLRAKADDRRRPPHAGMLFEPAHLAASNAQVWAFSLFW